MKITLKQFKETAENLGIQVSEPIVSDNETTINLHIKTPSGKDWWEEFTFATEADLKDALFERIDSWDSSEDAEKWTDEDTDEVYTIGEGEWKEAVLTDLYVELYGDIY